MTGRVALAGLRAGGKLALARMLVRIEAAGRAPATIDLLDAAWGEPRAQVVGLTGPPGVGKSTLLSALIGAWRACGVTVGVIAVDPSSKRTHGALLGDRTRLVLDPEDPGCFVRSMAARDRLGGVAELCFPAVVLMRALFDIVLIETVGVGQSETEVGEMVDTTVLAVQPASGDSLQFMKSGIAEIPDIAVVTKADLGAPALLAAKELEAALHLARSRTAGWTVPVLLSAANSPEGTASLLAAMHRHRAHLAASSIQADRHAAQAEQWLERSIAAEHGRHGLRRLSAMRDEFSGLPPFVRSERLLGLFAN